MKQTIEEKRAVLKVALDETNRNVFVKGDYGLWRPAYHDEPGGGRSDVYVSNYYGIAMHSLEIRELSEEELDNLIR